MKRRRKTTGLHKELIWHSGSIAIYSVSSEKKYYLYDNGYFLQDSDNFEELYKVSMDMRGLVR